jgi:hypothetical protein
VKKANILIDLASISYSVRELLTKLRQFSKGQKLFVFMIVFVSGLLFYANAMAFNLVSAPMFANDIVAYVALTVAVIFAISTLTLIFRDMQSNAVALRIKKQQVICAVKESEEASGTVPLPDPPRENISEEKIKIELSEKDNQSLKQLKIERTKLICPACRKVLELPIYLGEMIVDFGPPKTSNLVRQCRYCGAIIALKQKDAPEEVWKE